jgi:hypothetical protein
MGAGLWGTPEIRASAQAANGDLIVAGYFTHVAGQRTNSVARWNGSTWSPIGGGLTSSSGTATVLALTMLPSGNIVAGGDTLFSEGVGVGAAAMWNGTGWGRILPSPSSGTARALAVLPNGDLLVGGTAVSWLGTWSSGLARWNGSQWSVYGNTPAGAVVQALTVMPNGDVVAAGQQIGGVQPYQTIQRSNGTAWSPVGDGTVSSGIQPLSALLATPDARVVIGGFFSTVGGVTARNVAVWDGSVVAPIGDVLYQNTGATGVLALARRANGHIIAGGTFGVNSFVSTDNIAEWDGVSWTRIGAGLRFGVERVEVLSSGDIVAMGLLSGSDGVGISRPWRWTTRPACAADFDCSGTLAIPDIFDFLNAWLAGDTDADFNGGGLSVQDIFDYLNSWFAGCH